MQKLLAPLLVGALAPTLALADTIKVPSQAPTIQEALDAAAPGDTVLISSGRYDVMGLTLPEGKDGVSIVGKGRVHIDGPFWDGRDDPYPAALRVLSDDVTVRGLRFRHAEGNAIEVGTEESRVAGFRLERCEIRNARRTGVSAWASDCVVTNSRIRGCNQGAIAIWGDDAELSKLRMRGLGQFGVTVTGDGLVYDRNLLRNVEDQDGLVVTGNGATIDRSTFRGIQQEHVEIVGDGATIRRCRMTLGDTKSILVTGDDLLVERVQIDSFRNRGIDVTGADARVVKTSVAGVGNNGIRIEGANAQVASSRVLGSASTAISINGVDSRAERNTVLSGDAGVIVSGDRSVVISSNVLQAGDDATGIVVSGDECAALRNRITEANGQGLSFAGDDGLIEGNVITECGAEDENGINLSGDRNEVRSNRVTSCDSSGISVRGSSNTVSRNRCEDNSDNGIRIFPLTQFEDGNHVLVARDNVLEDNLCRGNDGEGIENGGIATVMRGNTMTGNRTDLTNHTRAGADIVLESGNRFTTGGVDVEPQVGIRE